MGKSPCSSSFSAGKMVRDFSLPRYMKPIPLEALFVPSYTNTAAKRLRMRQVEHFRSLFQSHFPVKVSRESPARFILCAACGSVVLLYATRVFDYFVVIEIAFMDNQAQITETISRLDSEKVR